MVQQKLLGRYELLRKIGEGGMAEVYLARLSGEAETSRQFVIKRVRSREWEKADPSSLIDEARILVQLTHPNIVQVYELGREANEYYVVMEYVEGVNLEQVLNLQRELQRPLSQSLTLYIIQECLRALDYAHWKKDEHDLPMQVVHRDVSPQNILLTNSGVVKVVDFGIAKGEHRVTQTTAFQVKGKFAYMSPEQASGKAVDMRTDLFAIGLVLYELLTNHSFYTAENDLALLNQARLGPQDLSLALDQLDLGWQRVLQKALAVDVADRYQTAKEFLQTLQKLQQEKQWWATIDDLSHYLQQHASWFIKHSPEFSAAQSQETLAMEVEQAPGRWKHPLLWLGGVVVLVSLFLFIFSGDQKRRVSNLVEEGKVAAVTQPVVTSNKEESSVLAVKSEKMKQPPQPTGAASISIQARPWAIVSIPDFLKGKETPVFQLPVKSGWHEIQIYFPPRNLTITKKVRAQAEESLRCLIDVMDEEPELLCESN